MFFRVVNFLILKSYHKKFFFWKKDNKFYDNNHQIKER